MMRLIQSPATIIPVASAALLLGVAVVLSGSSSGPARAAATGSADAMSIDMDPGAVPANTNTSLGSVEQCARINENDVLDADEDEVDVLHIDITVEGIPAYNDAGTPRDTSDDSGGIIGFQFNLVYPAASLTPQPGASLPMTSILGANAGSSAADFSEPVPDDEMDGGWTGVGFDAGTGTPEHGSGVLQRIALASDSGAVASQQWVGIEHNAILDAQGSTHFPITTNAANVAIGQACGPLVTPGPTSIPTPFTPPASTSSPTPTRGPTPPPGDYRMEAMSIDMDPGAAPANTNTSVGSLEQCARINENDVLDADEDEVDAIHVDITAEGIPAVNNNGTPLNTEDDAGGIIGFQYDLAYPARDLTIANHSLGSGSPFGSKTSIIAANAGSSIVDASEVVPDDELDSRWSAAVLDVGFGLPEAGSGVIQGLVLESDSGAGPGQYALNLNNNAHLDATGGGHFPKVTRIANIAIGQACGPLVTPAPTPSPSPTRTPRPATPTLTPTPLLTAGPPTPTPCSPCTPGPTPMPCAPPCPQSPSTPTPGSTPSDGSPTDSTDDVGTGTPTPTPPADGAPAGGAPSSPTPTPTPSACILDDNDFDDDGRNNRRDKDDDNDGVRDSRDRDDDNDGIRDRRDSDDDNDGISDRRDRNDGKLYCPDENDDDDDDDD